VYSESGGPADALRSWLELEGVPAVVESRLLASGVERTTFVCCREDAGASCSLDQCAAAPKRCGARVPCDGQAAWAEG